jgi:hypothetical protein
MRIYRAFMIALAAWAECAGVSACTAHPVTRPTEILDEQSGNTLVVVAQPLVFARERTDVAAHARDYATLVAIEIDHSGKYNDYLLLYRWSTVDSRMSAPPDSRAGELRILADGRRIDLTPLPELPVSLARRRELHVPNHGDPVVHAYPADPTLLRYIAASRDLAVRMPQEPLDAPFGIFEDGRPALGDFAQSAGPQ